MRADRRPQRARAEAMERRRRSGRSLLTVTTVAVILSAVGASAGGGTASAKEAGHVALQRHAGSVAATLPATSAGQAASTAQIDSLTVSPNPAVVGTDLTISLQYSGGSPQSEFGFVITDLNDDFDPFSCTGTLVSGTSSDGTEQDVCPIPLGAYVGLYDIQVVLFNPGPPPSVQFLGGETPFTVVSLQGPELKITTSSLPNGSMWSRTDKTHYLADLVASGGNPPYKWSLTGGSLPPGLTLHRGTGVISGKATATGTYSFTVQAVDKRTRRTRTTPSSQYTATAILSIQIS